MNSVFKALFGQGCLLVKYFFEENCYKLLFSSICCLAWFKAQVRPYILCCFIDVVNSSAANLK